MRGLLFGAWLWLAVVRAADPGPDIGECHAEGACGGADGDAADLIQIRSRPKHLEASEERASGRAGPPLQINDKDLFNIHDLLIVGYYAPMTKGPHSKEYVHDRLHPNRSDCDQPGTPPCIELGVHKFSDEEIKTMEETSGQDWPEKEEDYGGLMEARKGAVMLAKILPRVHPVAECRHLMQRNVDQIEDDEKLVEVQAATAWACVGVEESMVVGTGDGKEGPFPPLTTVRTVNGTLKPFKPEVYNYRNMEIKIGDQLGACYQPFGSGGKRPNGAMGRNTAWLRACTFWSSFHTMAARADALAASAKAARTSLGQQDADEKPFPPPYCSTGVNPDYCVYKDPGCKDASVVGCKADGVNDECRYCGEPASGQGYVYASCPTDVAARTACNKPGGYTRGADTPGDLDLPGVLFGSIMRIISGGAIFCGGWTLHFRMFVQGLLPKLAPGLMDSLVFEWNEQQWGKANAHMMMLTQCVAFQPASNSYWTNWFNKSTISNCDWQEVMDMSTFSEFLAELPAKGGFPDLIDAPVPLSTVLVAHHNLVTYGVPFPYWTNPGPDKTYYTPKEAIGFIASAPVFKNDQEVQSWAKGLQPSQLNIDGMPGMDLWVRQAKAEWASPPLLKEDPDSHALFLTQWLPSHNLTTEQVMAF